MSATIAEETGVSLEISHFKTNNSNAEKEMDFALGRIEKANKDGLNVSFDFFPYNFSASVLYTILPEWVTEGGKRRVLDRLKNHEVQRIVAEDLRAQNINFDNIIIATANVTKNYIGRSIKTIAEREGIIPEEMTIHLLIANDDKVIAFFRNYPEYNLKNQARSPHSVFVSDGFGVSREVFKEGVLVHPRCYSAFTKFIEDFVVNEKIISLEDAIAKMTSVPAKKVGIPSRGLLEEGYYADMVLLKLEEIKNRASIENPFISPEGVEYVFVNGKMAVSQGKYTGAMSGEMLRKK
jgi:N-acyl-D-amino-acid deacylase